MLNSTSTSAASNDTDHIKEEVRQWWNERPCGSTVSSAEFGSREFFDQVERHRYEQEYHLPGLVNFPLWKDKAVLEIGCGMGTDLLQFARAGAQVTGIDLTPRSVEITRARFALYGCSARLEVGDAEALRLADNSFDLVYSHGVLHHTPDTQRAVDEVYRVLKPGGTAMVMLYHRHSYNYLVNVCVLRRVAFALLRRGVSAERLSGLAGVNVDLLREYKKVVRGKSQWTLQDLLNNNTDGPGNPLSKVFSRAEARRLFRGFRRVDTQVHWLVKKNIPLLGKYLPRPVDSALGRLAGWDLHIIAVK